MDKSFTEKVRQKMSFKKRGKKNPNWKEGISKKKKRKKKRKVGSRKGKIDLKINETRLRDGYVEIKLPSHPFSNAEGYIFEHRIKMEKKLKRYLKKEEVVHHINGNRKDNRLKNLKLFKNNSDHLKFERSKK